MRAGQDFSGRVILPCLLGTVAIEKQLEVLNKTETRSPGMEFVLHYSSFFQGKGDAGMKKFHGIVAKAVIFQFS